MYTTSSAVTGSPSDQTNWSLIVYVKVMLSALVSTSVARLGSAPKFSS